MAMVLREDGRQRGDLTRRISIHLMNDNSENFIALDTLDGMSELVLPSRH
jgi:hypothetical protein